MLPNFIIIGAQKSATSWLNYCLSQHPEVYTPQHKKEIHYFDKNYDKGLKWYEHIFKSASKTTTVGETTPGYLFHPLCARRIYETLSNVKLIVSLRNPVDRAFSQYKMILRKKGLSPENLSFKRCWKLYPGVIGRGLYSQQLERYFKFFKNENMLILLYDDICKHPMEQIKKICEFLNIETTSLNGIDFKGDDYSRNTANIYKSYFIARILRKILDQLEESELYSARRLAESVNKKVSKYNSKKIDIDEKPTIMQELKSYYSNDINKLSLMINRNFDFWL